MTKKNNAKCTREACEYNSGFYSRIVATKNETPKQCPRCKRYGTVVKL
jgi:hypothetical protein